jgi:hypothetical protein
MGLFNIEEFLMAQQCCWIFRCYKSCRDNWRNDVFELSLGNPLSFSPQNTDVVRHPVLYVIACAFERFRAKFDKQNENYLTGCIFFNPILYREDRDKRTISPEYLGISDNNELIYRLATTEIQNLCGIDGIRTREDLATDGIQLTVVGYGRLTNAFNCFFDRMANHRNETDVSKSIKDEFCSIRKPGRKCRKVLSTSRIGTLGDVTTVKTFFRLITVPYIGDENFSEMSHGGITTFYRTGSECLPSNSTITFWALTQGHLILLLILLAIVHFVQLIIFRIRYRTKPLNIYSSTALPLGTGTRDSFKQISVT